MKLSNKLLSAAIAALIMISAGCQVNSTPVIVKNSVSKYKIVLPVDAGEVDKVAAGELQSFIEQISGAKLEITDDNGSFSRKSILLGKNRHLGKLDANIDFDKLGKEGFTIITRSQTVVIAGSGRRATLYGVYTFLEDYLGCRWYSSRVSKIPRAKTIELPADIDDTQVPILGFREVYYADAMDPWLSARLKLNGNASVMKDGKMLAEFHNYWATWCHNAFKYVKPEDYFQSNPDYFGLVDGERKTTKVHAQLCYSHPDLPDIVVNKIKEVDKQPALHPEFKLEHLDQRPFWADAELKIWDVSQMDGSGACQCERCAELDSKASSQMGSLLTFVNSIAEQLPHKNISTLAYVHTITAPQNMQVADNVSIKYIFYGTAAMSDGDSYANQIRNLEKWGKLCDEIFIWDYVVDFHHLYMPFPNLAYQQEVLKKFIDCNVKGVFYQGSREVGGEFCELRNYVLAKLMWKPDIDVDAVIDEFVNGYYGPAGKDIRRYIDLMHDYVTQNKLEISIVGNPKQYKSTYLSESMVEKYMQCFNAAEQAVKDDAELLLRVQTAKIPVIYTKIFNEYGSVEQRLELLEQFNSLCKTNGILKLNEGGYPPSQFYNEQLEKLNNPKAVAQNIPTAITEIAASEKTLVITTSAGKENAKLIELRPYEEYSSEKDFPVVWQGELADKPLEISRFKDGRDRLYSKFQLIDSDTAQTLGPLRWVTDLSAIPARDFDFKWEADSVKGLSCIEMTEDAKKLGVNYATDNIWFDKAFDLFSGDPMDFITIEGEKVPINMEYFAQMDRLVRSMTDAGINLTMVLNNTLPADIPHDHPLHHPGNIRSKAPRPHTAINITNRRGFLWYRALMEFVAERYSRPDKKYGLISGYIVGNEVQAHWEWYNMGEIPQNEFIKDYVRAMRVTDLAVRKIHSKLRIYISMEHYWNRPMFFDKPLTHMPGKKLLEDINALCIAEGNFGWNVAHHPYPEDLFNPKSWLDQSARMSFNTDRVTYKNIEVLSAFLRQPEFLYKGKQRRIVLSEQGVNQKDEPNGEIDQAAGYAYAYYRISNTPGIDAFMLHRHVDHPDEGGLMLGLRTWDNPSKKKYIYEVFRLADTDQWQEAFEFAKPIIGIKDWNELLTDSAAINKK
ncbi:DUF4838 domain-containing protein [Planctomycetota bacterium]